MKIVALLGVKDEVELIGASIQHLRALGVDLIIAYDDGSTDTREVLEALKTENDLWVVHVDRVEPWSQAITETWRLAWARKVKCGLGAVLGCR